MRIPAPTRPFTVELPIQHRQVLDLLRDRTGRSLKALVLEALEDLASKHCLVEEPAHEHRLNMGQGEQI